MSAARSLQMTGDVLAADPMAGLAMHAQQMRRGVAMGSIVMCPT